jgi:uncharacterized phage protein (TIGR01671 family)
MREIKFRVWDKDCKRMHVCGDDTHDTIYFFEDNCACYYNLQNGEGSSPDGTGTYKLMQYTGLKDKNGVEIYEGDICNCREYECFGKVEWNNEEAGFYFCVVMEGGGFEEERLYDYVDELEVIGNIYENPDLLEVTE